MDDYLPITFFDFTQVRYLSWFPVDTLVMPISLVPVEIWSIKQICNIIMRTLNCLKMKMFDLYSTSALILNSVLPVSMWVFYSKFYAPTHCHPYYLSAFESRSDRCIVFYIYFSALCWSWVLYVWLAWWTRLCLLWCFHWLYCLWWYVDITSEHLDISNA